MMQQVELSSDLPSVALVGMPMYKSNNDKFFLVIILQLICCRMAFDLERTCATDPAYERDRSRFMGLPLVPFAGLCHLNP